MRHYSAHDCEQDAAKEVDTMRHTPEKPSIIRCENCGSYLEEAAYRLRADLLYRLLSY